MRIFYPQKTDKTGFLKNSSMIFLLFIFSSVFSLQLSAQNYIVNSNGDTHVAVVGAGTGVDAGGNITLRSAIEDATARAGAHIITFSGAVVSPINLTLGHIITGNAANGNNITIDGPGMNLLTVNQTTASRIFTTGSGAVTFFLQDITLNYTGPTTAAAVYSGGGGAILAGGAAASTTLLNVTISNFVQQLGNGGAISQSSSLTVHTLTITNCVFINNRCGGAGGAVSFNSGAVTGPGGNATITGCVFNNNRTAFVGDPTMVGPFNTGGDGGAVSVTGGGNGGTYLIEKNTFLNNQVENNTGHAGAVMNTNGTLTLRFNRFIGNTCANVAFPPLANIVGQAGGAGVQTTIADNNWWGVNTGPGANDATALAVGAVMTVTKWLHLKHTASPTSVVVSPPGFTTLTASFLTNSASEAISLANLSTLLGLPIIFNNAVQGVISSPQTIIQTSGPAAGTATAIYTVNASACPPSGFADATVDNGTATATITIIDNIPPTIGVPGANTTIDCPATPPFTAPTASDNCPGVSVNHLSDVTTQGSCGGNYTVTRSWDAKDASNNHSATTVSQTITVRDITPPTIGQAGGNQTIECPASPTFVAPTASDACDGATVNFLGETTGGTTCARTVTRSWDATDNCNNHSATRTQTFTIIDTQAPTIGQAGGNQTIECPASPTFVAPTASDACDGATVNFLGETTGGTTCARTVTRSWDATDNCNNHSATRTQTFTIVDTQAPTIGQAGTDATIECTATPFFTAPTASDACNGATVNEIYSGIIGYEEEEDVPVIACSQIWIRIWDATDACGNHSATRTQTITILDTQAPTIGQAGTDATIECTATPVFTQPTASDVCSGAFVNLLTNTTTGTSCNRVYTRTWDATDACGNHSDTRTQVITVVDTQAPTIGQAGANSTIECTATPSFSAPTASDACSTNTVQQVGSDVTGGNSCTKTTTRTWVAVDACGNSSATRSQTITQVDTQPPTISNAGANTTVECLTTTPSFTAPTASDACNTYTVVQTGADVTGGTLTVRTITRTWRAVDACGNSSTTRSQTITQTDEQSPTVSAIVATPSVLWPPDHKMRDVLLTYTSNDNCGCTPVVTVTSNESIHGTADNDQSPDWEINDATHIKLRAERGNGKEARVYTIRVTCTDASGNSGYQETEVRIAHNITGPTSGNSFPVGSTVNFNGVFWDKPGNKHTAQWLIDDNTIAKATVTEPSGTKNGKVTGSYKFTTAGVYRLQMNVTDQNKVTSYANTNEDLEEIVVIYDPNGGYTYGGGWYQSLAGAVVSNPASTGKASYGFTVNYYKNATNPKGESQFEFKVGTFEFNALNFDYLAMQGARAQFRGTGKITGGQSGVGFIMTVIDGELDGTGIDKVRMKIYNKTTNAIYYDNQPGSDAANPVTPVGTNSSIVIGGTAGNNPITKMNAEVIPEELSVDGLEISVHPNPTSSNYTILVNAANKKDRIMLQVFDVHGRMVEVRNNINAGSAFRLGDMYRPGSYFIRVMQGKEHKEMKLIKLSD